MTSTAWNRLALPSAPSAFCWLWASSLHVSARCALVLQQCSRSHTQHTALTIAVSLLVYVSVGTGVDQSQCVSVGTGVDQSHCVSLAFLLHQVIS